jgi:hypothetical protein
MERLALILMLVVPATAVAAGNPHFDAAKKAWDNFEIERVLPLLEKAMSAATDLREKTEILELRARVQISQEQTEAARATFVELLALAPNYRIPESSSPKIRTVFEEARASLPPATEPPGDEPKEVDMRPVAPAGGTALWETWWFWTIVGGVVVAGGAALTVALVSSNEPEADLGPFLMR